MPTSGRLLCSVQREFSGTARGQIVELLGTFGYALTNLLCLVFVGIAVCWFLGRIARHYRLRLLAKEATAEREWQARLTNPRYSEVEAHTGFAVPRSLHELYAEPGMTLDPFQVPIENTSDGERGRWEVSYFLPLDRHSLTGIFEFELRTCLPFASDDGHGYYYLPLELSTSEDGPVYYVFDSDVGGGFQTEKVADSLLEFLGRREPIKY